MDDESLCYTPASDLVELVRARRISPVEITRAVLARARHLQPVLNCFITLCEDEALAAARRAEDAVMREAPLGALHGVPYTVKDLVDTRGIRTTYGSRVHANFVPGDDAVAVARLNAAGAILIGKTTTPEFGHKPLTEAPLFGRTRNAWSAARTCGGSSGGAAVAVAAGIAPLAIATDGGGSTRIPAACNGVVGFKQSVGVVPHSQAADVFGNYTYVTPTSRTVLDTALMLTVMAGEHPVDPWSYVVTPDFLARTRQTGDLAGFRIGWTPVLGNTVVAEDVRIALERCVHLLAGQGAHVEELVHDFASTEPVWRVINHATWAARFAPLLPRYESMLSETLVRQLREVANYSAEDFQKAAFMRTQIFRQVQGWMQRYDILVTPTLSRTALPIDFDMFAPIPIDGRNTDTARKSWYPYTLPFNLTGHPAVSMPAGLASDGLPVGIQLIGRFRGDADLLRVCAALEAAGAPLPRPVL